MKKLFNSLMLVLLIAAIFVFYEEMKPVRINANDLANEYSKDKTEADNKYLQKEIEIKGIAKGFYELSDINNMLQLKTDSNSVNIYCIFPDSLNQSSHMNFQPGDKVLLEGTCLGIDKFKSFEGLKIEIKKINK